MTNVLIVSKTRMNNGVCVGAIDETTCELIRIHTETGANLPFDAPFETGERWSMEVKKVWNCREEPHVEDKETSSWNFLENVGIRGIVRFITGHNWGEKLTRGSLRDTFQGLLNFAGNRNFINEDGIPDFSTQFWIPDRDLVHVSSWGNDYYVYDGIRVKHVGYQECVERIPAGTIVRLSLAGWWDGDGSGESRCYLQLSGWYL